MVSRASGIPTAVRFDVADVTPATKPMPLHEYRPVLASQINGGFPSDPDRNAAVAASIDFCSGDDRRVVDSVRHGFLGTLFLAFLDHRPVTLSPDMIWLLLCQGVAAHVNADPDRYRAKLVAHAGTLTIAVQNDDLVPGRRLNPWDAVIDAFSSQVRTHIGPATHDLFVPRFSTTGPDERLAASVALLDAVQSYFEYHVKSISGIPTIMLEGTAQDWEQLADRAERLAALDLEWWIHPLRPVLRQFAAAARGEVDRAFWASIYRWRGQSGGPPVVTGWSAAFFPYLTDPDTRVTRRNEWLSLGGERLELLLNAQWGGPETSPRHELTMGEFSSGLSRAPFVWEYLGSATAMELVAGFVGATQDPDTLALRPDIGWAVRRSDG